MDRNLKFATSLFALMCCGTAFAQDSAGGSRIARDVGNHDPLPGEHLQASVPATEGRAILLRDGRIETVGANPRIPGWASVTDGARLAALRGLVMPPRSGEAAWPCIHSEGMGP